MKYEASGPFDSIESTHEFLALLCDNVTDTKKDIEQDVQKESSSKASRRIEALRLAVYNLEKLQLHVSRSRRILNDLRSIRRLLFEERTRVVPVTLKPTPEPTQKPSVAPFVSSLSPHVTRPNARPQSAAIA